ncbi:hypothetical protein GGTG_12731 [Gaeumannomyces tritici R3-111a-1]|uniref:Uncharacterized protein n=1 Tax=Gaeumannomyces tritici (strain R3-111a-1) TaxID=644352 RepID=J3PGV1_GAET3|nr:hypothetical protein GGTG_12731 [Gaeumannomyces tritici R3-111a-1]EJT69848.1 hypothetical protein GGTG_12731 [Gaeumannomyces tritici R3-111a-1]
MRGMKRYMLAPLPESLDSQRRCRRRVRFTEPASADQAAAATSPPDQRAYYDTGDVLICAFVLGCVIGYIFNTPSLDKATEILAWAKLKSIKSKFRIAHLQDLTWGRGDEPIEHEAAKVKTTVLHWVTNNTRNGQHRLKEGFLVYGCSSVA